MPYRKKGSPKGKWKTQWTQYKGEGNPNYRGPNTTCSVCGKPLRRSLSLIKKSVTGRSFCSQQCYWKSGIHKKPPKYKTCLWCKNKFVASADFRKFCSRRCYEHWYSENKKGKNNGNWKGGGLYPPEWTPELRKAIRQRDNYTCRKCGRVIRPSEKTAEKQRYRLEVHHVDWNKQNCDPANLISLCTDCHRKIHGRKLRQAYNIE